MGAKDVSHVQKLVLSALLGSEPQSELRALLGNPEIMTAVSGPTTYLLSVNLGDSERQGASMAVGNPRAVVA